MVRLSARLLSRGQPTALLPSGPSEFSHRWLWQRCASVSVACFCAGRPFCSFYSRSACSKGKLVSCRCGLVANAWTPGLWFAHDARPYAMLLFLAMINTVSFIALLPAHQHKKRFNLAGIVAVLLVLTHYFAGFLVICQGCLYLLARRGRAVRTWPAALILIPLIGWMTFHAPRIERIWKPTVRSLPSSERHQSNN